MALKKIKTHLTAAQYWEWRNAITEMWLEKAKLEQKEQDVKLMQKDIEILQLKAKLFSGTVVAAHTKVADKAKESYFELKKKLETALGQSLDGKVIDDLTFEIKNLEEPDFQDSPK